MIQTKLAEAITTALSQLTNQPFSISDVAIEYADNALHGDFSSNVAFKFAKQLQLAPMELAEKIVSHLPSLLELSKAEVATPGFINFFLHDNYFKELIFSNLTNADFGKGEAFAGQTILIEHTSPNPNKAFHIGHLKNNVTGLAVSYLLAAQGAKVFRDCIDNNRGISIAKLMWGYLEFGRINPAAQPNCEFWTVHPDQWHTPASITTSLELFIDQLYTQASEAFNLDLDVQRAVRQLVVDWENNHPATKALWRVLQDWVWQEFERVLRRIDGWHFDVIWHESDIYLQGKELVEQGLAKKIFKKLPDSAVLTNLKDFKIADTILIKNDGTSLYITQDLALSKLKKEKFKADKMFWVIGPEQSLAMKQMFAVCSQLGIADYQDFTHLPYGFILVNKPQGKIGKMASRDGTQIYVTELIEKAKAEIMLQLDSTTPSKQETAETLAIAAIKYSLLKVEREQDMVFDFATSVSFNGDSAPYIMYAYVRAKALLRKKAGGDFGWANSWQSEYELNLIKLLSKYPQVVSLAAQKYAPNLIAAFLFELAQEFSRFYTQLPIIDDPAEASRLALAQMCAHTIQHGFSLLGIKCVEQM